ncbi:MAG: T9SS type A sorting domain-containing protein [Vicingaceae bacterium]|nr:T9SS type A sorting domain-containing protein [Vicingaceae bacterium]
MSGQDNPNPNNGSFTIEHNLKEGNYVLEIVDIMGKMVHQENIPIAIGTQQQTITNEQLSKGLYFITIKTTKNKLIYTSKMSVVR